jgi:hypothetical protein
VNGVHNTKNNCKREDIVVRNDTTRQQCSKANPWATWHKLYVQSPLQKYQLIS